MARAVLEAARTPGIVLFPLGSFRALPGRGLQANVDGRAIIIGSQKMMLQSGVDLAGLDERASDLEAAGRTVMWIGEGTKALGLIAVAERI